MSFRRLSGMFNENFAKNFGKENLSLVFGSSSSTANPEDFRSEQNARTLNGVVAVNLSNETQNWFSQIIPRVDWKRRKIFTEWDNTKNMDGKHFYAVVNDNGVRKVYWCLDNNDGGFSTIPPSGTDPAPKKYDDGYVWSYLYTISGNMTRFLTTKWIPIPDTTTASDGTLNSTDPLYLAKKTEDYWRNRPGSVIRFYVNHSQMNRVRFANKPTHEKIQLIEVPSNICRYNVVTEHYSNSVISTEDGYSIRDIVVTDPGKNYSHSYENLLFTGQQPTFPTDFTQNLIVGNTDLGDIKAPLIYPVLSPQNFNFPTLFNADSSMIVYHVDNSRLAQVTDIESTGFNEVRLVKNLKDADDKNFAETVKSDVLKRMTTKITLSDTNVVSNGKKIASSQRNSLGKRAIGQIVSSKTNNTVLEVVNNSVSGGNFAVGDKVFDKTTLTPSLAASRTASISWAGSKHNSESASLVGGATNLATVASVDDPGIKVGSDTEVIHVTKLTNSDSYTVGLNAIQYRVVIGPEDNQQDIGRRSTSGY